METTINSNLVNPRYYQIPGDKLEAKQSMEPIAIGSGIGPITGFDIVDITQANVRITGSANPSITQAKRLEAWPIEQKTIKISKDGQQGTVVNSHITPSGLLSIDPVWLDTGLPVSQFNVHSFLIVRASLDYTTEIVNNLETILPPSISNFIFTRVTAWVHNGVPISTLNLLNTNYNGVLEMLGSAGITLNESKEVIIGIYEFNPPESIREQNLWFYDYVGNIIPNIPYYNIWPPRANFNKKLDSLIQSHSDKIQWLLDNRIIEVDTPNVKDGAITGPKIANGAITTTKITDGSIITTKVADKSITTVKVADNAITSEKIVNDAITADKIKDAAVSGTKIVNGAITADKLGVGAVSTDKLQNLVITRDKIANGAINADKIDSDAVNLDKLSNSTQIKLSSVGETRSLVVENKVANIYWIELFLQGEQDMYLPVSASMGIPIYMVSNISFIRHSQDLGGSVPTVKLYKFLGTGWDLVGTYQFTSTFSAHHGMNVKSTGLIPLPSGTDGWFKVTIE